VCVCVRVYVCVCVFVWQGSTSGLDHDFHNNLCVLIKGKKMFTLFNPKVCNVVGVCEAWVWVLCA
jgi:hypothetical protein